MGKEGICSVAYLGANVRLGTLYKWPFVTVLYIYDDDIGSEGGAPNYILSP